MTNKLFSYLGLSKRAGYILEGFDAVKTGILSGKVQLVLTTTDLSDNSYKKITTHAKIHNVHVLTIPYTKEDMQRNLGKESGIVAVTDKGMCEQIKNVYSNSQGGM